MTKELTDEQKIAYLAEKVMGWYADIYRSRSALSGKKLWWNEKHVICGRVDSWNPLTDWNHWRQVEEKVMEDPYLWGYFTTGVSMKSNLEARVDRLITSHTALHANN